MGISHIGNNSLSNYTAYKINEATSSEYISGGLDESTATFVDLGETTVNAITKCDTYISNVGVLSSADKAKIDEAGKAAAAGNAYYQYTGNTGNGDIYAEATTPNSLSYTRNYYYRLGIGSDGYSWTRVTITFPSATTTLDGILEDLILLSKRLGHRDVKETLNTYSHLFPNAQRKILESIDEGAEM